MDYSLKVGIHQPSFLPWFSFFYKLVQSDCFIYLDHVEHSKKSFNRRVYIHHPHILEKSIYSRLYLQKHSDYSLINQLVIHREHDWIKNCLKQWKESYQNAPYYEKVIDHLTSILEDMRSLSYMSEINIGLIEGILDMLGIKRTFRRSSEFELVDTSQHINIELCKCVGATHYLSGQGAKKYQSQEEYISNDIELVYLQVNPIFEKYDIPTHIQNKSIIAWLMYYSVEEISSLLHQ